MEAQPPETAELLQKIQDLEAGHAHLREEITRLMLSRPKPEPEPERRRLSIGESSMAPAPLMEEEYLNILQSMGQAVHVLDSNSRVIYWNRSAENLYGYSAEEALGKSIYELIIETRDSAVARGILDRNVVGQNWTGQFPIRHKMGNRFIATATTSQLYDDDGTLVGVIIAGSASQPFEEVKVSIFDAKEPEASQSFNQPIKSVTTKLGLDPEQPLQTAIASKLTNLASKVSSKVRSKLKTGESNVPREGGNGDIRHSDHGFHDDPISDHKEDGCSSGESTPRGDPVGAVLGISSQVGDKTPAQFQRESSDDSEEKTGIKMLTSKAEAWLGKKTKQWPWKGNERDTSDTRIGRFVWPWLQGEQDADNPTCSVKSESWGVEYSQPSANDASGFWSSFHLNSNSSHSSCGSSTSSVVNKLDLVSDCLDYEIMWEDLTVAEQIGQGSCGVVYHGFWYGSDVAIKVFFRQEYSDDAILSFRQEVVILV